MGLKVRDVMTGVPVMLQQDDSLTQAARRMRDHAVGCVLVADGSRLRGLVTDRDIVVRAIAESRDPARVSVGEVCSGNLAWVSPDDDVDEAVTMMRRRAVRRLPVVEEDRAVGIVSLGDLALGGDESAALADISAAPPNA
ncbi:MAG: CBS domain-containing protein [Micromonosporaceae bacterium]